MQVELFKIVFSCEKNLQLDQELKVCVKASKEC